VRTQWGPVSGKYGMARIRCGRSGKRVVSRQNFVRHDHQSPNVQASSGVLPAQLFRRHVSDSADQLSGPGLAQRGRFMRRRNQLDQAEVQNLRDLQSLRLSQKEEPAPRFAAKRVEDT